MPEHRGLWSSRLLILFGLAVLVLGTFVTAAQTDEELKKKYGPILGSWKFDMTAHEMGVMVIEVYVDYGSLWVHPETSDSAERMIPVEDEEFSFTVEDPDEGTYQAKFLKDDDGDYSECHVINGLKGVEAIGTKIK